MAPVPLGPSRSPASLLPPLHQISACVWRHFERVLIDQMVASIGMRSSLGIESSQSPGIALTCFREKRKLGLGIAAAISELGRIIPRKAMVGELRPDRIAAFLAHRPVNAVAGEERERIATDIGSNF